MNKYEKACLYIIECIDATNNNCYVGSSVDFKNRMNTHHHDYKTKPNSPLYTCIRDNGGWANWIVNQIDKPCHSLSELRQHEQDLKNKLKPSLNVNEAKYQSFDGEEFIPNPNASYLENNRNRTQYRTKKDALELQHLRRENQNLKEENIELNNQLTKLKTKKTVINKAVKIKNIISDNNIAMQNLKEYIKEKRPNLGASSITTYNSILMNLYKHVFGNINDINVKNFDETEPILKHLGDMPSNKRKTILSALVIVTDDKKYRDLMLADIKTYSTEINKQEKTDTQKENWIETSEVKQLWDSLKQTADLLYKKAQLTSGDLQQIQSFIIISLLGGMFIPPRRSLDFVNFKIKETDKAKDNYIDKKELIFNSYKTCRFYGEQKVELPSALKSILTKWCKVNPTNYLLFDSNFGQLSSVKLNQRLNKIFNGKKISVNMLRKSYLSGKYGDTIKTNHELAADLSQMGSSTAQATTYIKQE